RTLDQTRYWQNSRALFTRALEVNPESFSANQNMGVLSGYEAQFAEADAETRTEMHDAVGAQADQEIAHARLAEAERYLAKVLQLKPKNPFALHTRAALRARF